MVNYIRGGIGDILIRLGSIKPNEHYTVISHYDKAADLIKPYTNNFTYIPMQGSIANIEGEIETTTYPELRIPKEYIEKAKNSLPEDKIIIGIHPIGSKMSIIVDHQLRRPKKYMPPEFILGVVNELKAHNIEFLLFCAPEEVSLFNNLGLRIVCEEDIWNSFAYVACCDMFLSVESALKTVSAILHIPTVVAIGEYHDPWRVKFIDSYVEITAIRFYDIRTVFTQFVNSAKLVLKTLSKNN